MDGFLPSLTQSRLATRKRGCPSQRNYGADTSFRVPAAFSSVFLPFTCAQIRTLASFRVVYAPYLCVKSSSQTSPISSDRSRASSSRLSSLFPSFFLHVRTRRAARRRREDVRRCCEMEDEIDEGPRAPLHLTRRLTGGELHCKAWEPNVEEKMEEDVVEGMGRCPTRNKERERRWAGHLP